MQRLSIALSALAVSMLPSLAQDIPGCENASSNVELGNCTYAAYQAADKELNDVWSKALASITGQADDMPADALAEWKDKLLTGQRAWITFKENDCGAVEFEWYGGSGASQAEGACLYGHTAARVEDLKARYLDRGWARIRWAEQAGIVRFVDDESHIQDRSMPRAGQLPAAASG